MGIFDRFGKSDGDDGSAEVGGEPTGVTEVTDEEIRAAVAQWLLPGFFTRADLVTAVGEYLEIEGAPRVAAIVDEQWTQRVAEEASWSGPGDYAKVASAFDALAEQGIVGRMNFTCCQTCGTAEIDDERTARPDAPEGEYAFEEWGYTFFHEQDAERLAEAPATLYLSYSTFTPAPDVDAALLEKWGAGDTDARDEVIRQSDTSVGRRVAEALRAEGLTVDWDGSSEARIAVTIDDWRKPLPR